MAVGLHYGFLYKRRHKRPGGNGGEIRTLDFQGMNLTGYRCPTPRYQLMLNASQFLSEFSLSTLYKNYTKILRIFQIFKVRIPNIEVLLLVPTLKILSIAFAPCMDPCVPYVQNL